MEHSLIDASTKTRHTAGSLLGIWHGHIPGFDCMRFVAASAVVFSHSFGAAENRQAEEPLRQLTNLVEFGTLAVYTFFFISGFIVTQSCFNSASRASYLLKRTARIMPGLILVTLVCALLLGPAVTSYSLGEYFLDSKLYKFLLNCVFVLKGELPGVFTHNPSGDYVNVSLWTLRHEVLCYVILLLVVAKGRFAWLKIGSLAVTLAVVAEPMILGPIIGYSRSIPRFAMDVPYLFRETMQVIPFFFVGSLYYYVKDHLPMNFGLLILSLAAAIATIVYGAVFPILPFALGYAILYAGLSDNRVFSRFGKNDYSYGIYIFGFPVQQTAAAFFPGGEIWWGNFLLSYPIVICLAILSWHLVERPCLRFARSLDKTWRERPSATLARA